MIEKRYKSVDGIKVEFSPEEYAQAEIDCIDYETNVLPKEIRDERNKLLTECDWTQALDTPTAVRNAWAAYRQALRDVPQQPGFPTNINWPTQP